MPNRDLKKIVEDIIEGWKRDGFPLDYETFPPFYPDTYGSCEINSERCPEYLGRILGYLRNSSREINVEIYDDPRSDGKVDINIPDTIFISSYISDNNLEIKRTVIHELAHLVAWNESQHGDDKNDCDYFMSMPLVCEYCLTGVATMLPHTFSNSKMNTNKTICIISK